jgi:hypothetical protein
MLSIAGVLGTAGTAHGSDDAAAMKLRDDAIGSDYLASNFPAAEKKLTQALSLCDSKGCSPKVTARLHCDLATVYFVQDKSDEAHLEFVKAATSDPTVSIDKDLSNPKLEAALAAARPATDGSNDGSATPQGAAADTASAPAGPLKPRDPSDCPPSFPGCQSKGQNVGSCVSDDDCSAGQTCHSFECTGTRSPEPESDAPAKDNWVNLAFQQDLLFMPSRSDACGGGTGYTCFDESGSYYARRPLGGADDVVNGGVVPATMRVLAGYDRALTRNIMIGARVGFAFAGGPQRPAASAFLPLHAEARGTYWFGKNPLGREGLRFFALAAAGVAQVDASVSVNVYDSMTAYRAGQSAEYQAWKKTGLGFAALGVGGMFALTRSSGILAEVKAIEMFPTPSTGLGVQVGYSVGL